MRRIAHAVMGTVALATIATFWLATAISELFGSPHAIARVKTTIVFGMLVLVPALVGTAVTGSAMARRRRGALVAMKKRRMPIIAANGVLLLLPSALFLHTRAAIATFDAAFYAVQTVELLAGAANITLLALSFRDGLRLTGRLRR